MNYKETLDFLYNKLPMFQRIGKAAYKANLDNTLELDREFGHPHRLFKSIHVAGTNGKGSVSHMLASIFQASGYKTGLYTSPHLLDFRERIRVNGKAIGEEDIIRFVSKIEASVNTLNPSFFEITVAMAFDYFANQKVDIAIIETGLGGRLDSTNIITPEVSVITNISLDHTEFLGNSLHEIATEKAGIIKKNVPLVIGSCDPELLSVFETVAAKNTCELYKSADTRVFKYQTISIENHSIIRFENTNSKLDESWEIDLLGNYQQENLSTTLQIIDVLINKGWTLPDQKVSKGLLTIAESTGLRGRWEILGANPKIIGDTAHNEAGIREVVKQLSREPAKKLHIIWGMVNDKSLDTILPLLPTNAEYYFTAASIPRALDAKTLGKKGNSTGLKGGVYPDVKSSIEAAINKSDKKDLIFIGGSTFVVADALKYFIP